MARVPEVERLSQARIRRADLTAWYNSAKAWTISLGNDWHAGFAAARQLVFSSG
jgi:hypothetical protein